MGVEAIRAAVEKAGTGRGGRADDVRPFVEASPFEAVYWLHYWDGSALDGRPPSEDELLPFTRNPIDYGLGFVKRTPDHPTMNEGVTSVVVDLVKLAGR